MNEETIQLLISQHESRLNSHGSRIDKIENNQAETNVKIDNLCKSIDSLTSVIKWVLGVCMTSLIGFFIWVIQNSVV